MNKQTMPDTDEAWDERVLGHDESFVEIVSSEEEAQIDEAAGTQLISIRMQKSMIEDMKMIASLNNGIGYQTLMKQILQRVIDSEKKRIFAELVAEKVKAKQKAVAEAKQKAAIEPEQVKPAPRQRKAA